MIKLTVLSYLLLVCDLVVTAEAKAAIIPDVTVEVLKNGSFRAYIPDIDGLKYCAFHAKINKPIQVGDPGDHSMEVHDKTGGFLIASFQDTHIKVGDNIHFWIFCSINRLGHERSDLSFTISDLLDEYPLLSMKCVTAATVFDRKDTCVGDVIFEDDFSAPTIVGSKWVVEHWIPTYTAPKFLFNSYENSNDTVAVKNGRLVLKPIPMDKANYRHHSLDLRHGCTSTLLDECYISSETKKGFPAVRASKIVSRTSFRYGKVEIKAKLPAGDWIYPIIQLEQKVKENGENSPTVWIAYSQGNRDVLGNDGQNLGAPLIFGGPVFYQVEPLRSQKLVSKRNSRPFFEDFHLYSLEWKPDKMVFSIDNEQFGVVNLDTFRDGIDIRGARRSPGALFDKEYLLSLGVAVGGLVDFPDGLISSGNYKPWSNTDRNAIQRFWEKKDEWLKSWSGMNTTLQVDYVKITAI